MFTLLLGVKKAPKIAPKRLIYLTNYWWVVQGSSVSPLPYQGSAHRKTLQSYQQDLCFLTVE